MPWMPAVTASTIKKSNKFLPYPAVDAVLIDDFAGIQRWRDILNSDF
jgi:hypothetical protein